MTLKLIFIPLFVPPNRQYIWVFCQDFKIHWRTIYMRKDINIKYLLPDFRWMCHCTREASCFLEMLSNPKQVKPAVLLRSIQVKALEVNRRSIKPSWRQLTKSDKPNFWAVAVGHDLLRAFARFNLPQQALGEDHGMQKQGSMRPIRPKQ